MIESYESCLKEKMDSLKKTEFDRREAFENVEEFCPIPCKLFYDFRITVKSVSEEYLWIEQRALQELDQTRASLEMNGLEDKIGRLELHIKDLERKERMCDADCQTKDIIVCDKSTGMQIESDAMNVIQDFYRLYQVERSDLADREFKGVDEVEQWVRSEYKNAIQKV